MNIRGLYKIAPLAFVGALALTGCSSSEEAAPAASSVASSASAAAQPADATTPARADSDRDDRDDRDDKATEAAAAGNGAASGAPCEVTGFTDEARRDLVEEDLTEEAVRNAVSMYCSTAERDDDGWEIDEGPVDVEYTVDGVVTGVDRDR